MKSPCDHALALLKKAAKIDQRHCWTEQSGGKPAMTCIRGGPGVNLALETMGRRIDALLNR